MPSPLNNSRLKSLKQVLVLGCGLIIGQVLLWDVEVSLTSGLVRGHIQESHELVQVRHEFFPDAIRPAVVGQQLLGIVGLHGFQQVFHWIRSDLIEQNDLFDVIHGDWRAAQSLFLHEVSNLVVLHTDVLAVELRCRDIAHSEFLLLIETVPNEEALLIWIVQEVVDVIVVLVSPVLLLLEIL